MAKNTSDNAQNLPGQRDIGGVFKRTVMNVVSRGPLEVGDIVDYRLGNRFYPGSIEMAREVELYPSGTGRSYSVQSDDGTPGLAGYTKTSLHLVDVKEPIRRLGKVVAQVCNEAKRAVLGS